MNTGSALASVATVVFVLRTMGEMGTVRIAAVANFAVVGSALARAIATTDDLVLVAAVARRPAGQVLGEVLGEPRRTGSSYASAAEALTTPCDVFVEYTKPESAKSNILTALEHGAHVVEIDIVAREASRRTRLWQLCLDGVLLQKFAEAAARLIPQWEIIDYAHDDKGDAPSGTARALAYRLSAAPRHPEGLYARWASTAGWTPCSISDATVGDIPTPLVHDNASHDQALAHCALHARTGLCRQSAKSSPWRRACF